MTAKEAIKQYKVANYESITVVKDFLCPGCSQSGWQWNLRDVPHAKLVGWCETPQGFMQIYECPLCFTKFRFHGCTTERYDEDSFLEYLLEEIECYYKDSEQWRDFYNNYLK